MIGKYYKIIHYCSLIPTCLMALNAVYNLTLSVPPNVTTTILIDIERLILSAFIIALTIVEFNEKTQQRPQWLDKHIFKRSKVKAPMDRYNEVANNSSMITQMGPDYEKEMRVLAMKKLLMNLKNIKP